MAPIHSHRWAPRVLQIALFLAIGWSSRAEVQIAVGHQASEDAGPGFRFREVPPPARNDAATDARFVLVSGRADPNGGPLSVLHDGQVPREEDEPARNFFCAAGTAGGRLWIDLGRPVEIQQVHTYSWHPNTRGPQVYTLYAHAANPIGSNSPPGPETDLEGSGWRRIARVDTRPKAGPGGGQYGVSISDSSGALGLYRCLLFELARTEDADPFGNTFYSEIDVIDRAGPAPLPVAGDPAASPGAREIIRTESGQHQIVIDTTAAPDLTDWARRELAPVVREWYPKIVGMLPSDGYAAPARVTIYFLSDMDGVASTSGTRIRCAANWFRRNLDGEAKGAVVHELVHVVQDYGRARRTGPASMAPPGWLVEGIADYIRWFQYEPQSKGAEITARNLSRARYDGNYRVSANFLNWVVEKHRPEIIRQLNAAMREGRYRDDLWATLTGHTLSDLGAAWKQDLERRILAQPE